MIGIGIDAVEVERFRMVLKRRPRLLERLFTETEIESLSARIDPTPGLAARFAAKEAVMKALGVGLGKIGFREIEVVRTASGAPTIVVTGRAERLTDALAVTALHLSMTHTKLMASAVVFADGPR
jgi:holo-[acyl-carrier protein] synthase